MEPRSRAPGIVFAVFVVTLVASGFSGTRDKFFPAPDWALQGIRTATRVTLHEGLPHPMFERELLRHEETAKDPVRIGGWPFYQSPLPLTDADRRDLAAWPSGRRAFRSHRGPKACGGFHPDYAVEWSGERGPVAVLVCFGCNEVVWLDGVRSEHLDLANARPREILHGRRLSRPSRN